MGANTEQDHLLTVKEVAEILRLSRRQVFRLDNAARIPRALRIGRAVRWSTQQIHDWLAVGAPDRRTWESIKGVQL